MTINLALLALVVCTASIALTWVMMKIAPMIGLVDQPDGYRKLQTQAVPLGGGAAVLGALTGGVLLLYATTDLFRESGQWLGGLLIGSAVIVLVGIADDLFTLRGRHKLLGQLLAACILVACGLTIERFHLLGMSVELGIIAIPFSLFWLLGAVNSVNLLDGIDGLATSVGIIQSSSIAVLAALSGHYETAVVATMLAASLLGFLTFNFPPAKVYLGDAGSMLIGLLVGALAIHASLKGPGTVLLAAPLAVWTIPIFDSLAAIIRRKLTGRSVYTTDRGHLHHRVSQRVGKRATLAILVLACTATSLAAVASAYWRSDVIALVGGAAVVGLFVATRLFGDSELLLLASHAWGLGARFFARSVREPPSSWQASIRLQGQRQWELLWATLTDYADKLDLQQIRLDVNAPMLEESYHASWQRAGETDIEQNWKFELPLVSGRHSLGILRIVGKRNSGSASQQFLQLLDLLEPFEMHLSELTSSEVKVATNGSIKARGSRRAAGLSSFDAPASGG